MAELRRRDPKLYRFKVGELRVQRRVSRAAERLHDARVTGSAGTEALEDELRREVQVQLAFGFAVRAKYLQRLQEQIDSLKEQIDRDASNFDDTVERHMKRWLESMPPSGSADTTVAANQG